MHFANYLLRVAVARLLLIVTEPHLFSIAAPKLMPCFKKSCVHVHEGC